MNKKILLIPIILITTAWGFGKKKDLSSYVESARPSQTRTLKALAARLYLEALNATEDILILANKICDIEEYNADNTPCEIYKNNTAEIKHTLTNYIAQNEKRDETVRVLTKPVIERFNQKVSSIIEKYRDATSNALEDLFNQYKSALLTLHLNYWNIMNALTRVKATYTENNWTLPQELNFKTLGIINAIEESTENKELIKWFNESEYNNSSHLQ